MLKKICYLLFLSFYFTSCIYYVEPFDDYRIERNRNYYQPRDTTERNANPGSNNSESDNNSSKTGTNNTSSNTSGNTEPTRYYPKYKYDSCRIDNKIIFNVYLGYNVGASETVIKLVDYPKEGGIIDINIYPNKQSMSMYGFSKYYSDFYYFNTNYPYCGYNSYSLDTKTLCKYQMIISPNYNGETRALNGYWACNGDEVGYSSFKIILFQDY